MTQPTNPDFSTGRSRDHEDGDLALMVMGTVACPEVYSRNWMNSLGGESSSPVRDSSNAKSHHENWAPLDSDSDISWFTETETLEQLRRNHNKKMKEILITQGIKLATLNVRGKCFANGKSKYKQITTMM